MSKRSVRGPIQLPDGTDVGPGNPLPVSGSAGGTSEVTQTTHDDLNANANIQVGDVDVGAANPVPVSDAGGSLTVDGSVAVSSMPTGVDVVQPTHDDLNCNANVQQENVDVSSTNPLYVQLVPVPKQPLENSSDGAVDGKPIGVSNTATPGITIHTTTSNKRDLVTAWATNRTDTDRRLTLEFGGTASKRLIHVFVPAYETVPILDQAPIQDSGSGAITIAAFLDASTNAPDVNIFGYFEQEDV